MRAKKYLLDKNISTQLITVSQYPKIYTSLVNVRALLPRQCFTNIFRKTLTSKKKTRVHNSPNFDTSLKTPQQILSNFLMLNPTSLHVRRFPHPFFPRHFHPIMHLLYLFISFYNSSKPARAIFTALFREGGRKRRRKKCYDEED